VELVAVRSTRDHLYPGLAGVSVTGVIKNRSARTVTGASLGLTFGDVRTERGRDFVARQAIPWDGELAPGAELELPFVVDVAASADAARDIRVDGDLRFGGAKGGLVRATTPLTWRFLPQNQDLVVARPDDGDDGGGAVGPLTLRKALRLAGERPGVDRIVFSTQAFAPGQETAITLTSALGDLPTLDGSVDPVIISGPGNDTVAVRLDAGYEGSGRTPFRLTGAAVLSGLLLRELSRVAPAGNDCTVELAVGTGAGVTLDGEGAVMVGNHLVDTGVPARPCAHAVVAAVGGARHLVAGNSFEDPPAGAVRVAATGVVVRGNRVAHAGHDALAVDAQGTGVRIEGNLVTDSVDAGLVLRPGADVDAWHNTFVRCGKDGVQANAPGRLVLRNDVYTAITGAPIATTLGGSGVDAAGEATDAGAYCLTCTAARIDSPSMMVGITLDLIYPAGSSPAALTPGPASVLVDSGLDVTDRNGSLAGRYDGAGADRGAVETEP
jgi:hypothetical protein